MKLSAIMVLTLFVSSFAGKIYVDHLLPQDLTDSTYSIENRSGGGSDGRAYTHVYKAVAVMQPGDSVLIREGTYNEMNIPIYNHRGGRPDAWYTIMSYPGEWAIIDGEHDTANAIEHMGNGYDYYIFVGTTAGGAQGYFRFERLELTGGGLDTNDVGYPSSGGGIGMRGGPHVFKYLYIHNNYGRDNNNHSGLHLGNSTGATEIAYCYFKANGQPKPHETGSSTYTGNNTNLCIMSDYKYQNTLNPLFNSRGFTEMSAKNHIHHNLFDADAGNGYFTVVGFKQKAMQRLTGYVNKDAEDPNDAWPNDDTLKDYGDRIHHNIFLNHPVSILIDQDYAQVYNNISVSNAQKMANSSTYAIHGSDTYTNRRGPFAPVIYNNTLISDNSTTGIIFKPIPQNYNSVDTPYVRFYAYNNILDGFRKGWSAGALSVTSYSATAPGYNPDPDRLDIANNYFYNLSADSIILTHKQYYSVSTSPWTAFQRDDGTPLYQDTSSDLYDADRYKLLASHEVAADLTVENGGVNKPHPYLNGTIPSYIGASASYNEGWIDTVLALRNMSTLPPDTTPPDTLPPVCDTIIVTDTVTIIDTVTVIDTLFSTDTLVVHDTTIILDTVRIATSYLEFKVDGLEGSSKVYVNLKDTAHNEE